MNSAGFGSGRPSARTWLLAALELVAALVVTRLIITIDQPAAAGHHHHDMAGMSDSVPPTIAWSWLDYALIGVAAAALGWWLRQRRAGAAVVAAAALAAFAASPAIRALASGSHLIAMVGLELLMVACPLLALSAWPRRHAAARPRASSRGWTIFGVATALLYAGLLVVIHLPAVHRRGAELGSVPLWVAFVALPIAVAYWFAVLQTADRISSTTRRRLLLGAQEMAAFVGLLSLFGAWGAMAHTTPLGISAAWDQRLGGLVMMAACAAVTIPLLRRIQNPIATTNRWETNENLSRSGAGVGRTIHPHRGRTSRAGTR